MENMIYKVLGVDLTTNGGVDFTEKKFNKGIDALEYYSTNAFPVMMFCELKDGEWKTTAKKINGVFVCLKLI